MKKFAFSLQRMLAFKKTLYEKERNALAALRAERLSIQNRRDATERQMLQRDAAFRQKAASEGVRIAEVTGQSFHRNNADKLCKQLDGELLQKDFEIEKQLKVVIELDKEVKSLEKLRERQWEEYQLDAAREERERVLELVSRQYVDAQARGAQMAFNR